MTVRPIYNVLLLPDGVYHFKRDFFNGPDADSIGVGTDLLFVLLRRDIPIEKITPEEIYPIAVTAQVEAIGEENTLQIKVLKRVTLTDFETTDEKLTATTTPRPEIEDISEEEEKELFHKMRSALLKFVKNYPWGMWARGYILQRHDLYELASAFSDYLNITPEEKYNILAADSRRERIHLIEKAISEFVEIAKVAAEAQEAQKDNQEQLYREAALKKQIEYLQSELDDMHPENVSDVRKFEKKIEASDMNEEARREAEKVLNRMRQEGKNSHEYGMLYDYLDFLTSLSWKAPEFTPIDLERAEEILNEDHYGLEKVKERIIQQLAVMALNKKQYGSILLFVGPPGTGKTSIGQGIARALGREYVRISLGGIRDEAEIRGHRRTYIGAMPGRIMEGMKRCGSSNPVMVLDEVDKLAKDYSGDPASALLEVLDPEQNHTFTDHYMNVPYDLSNVLFVCTANSADSIPEPLLNRMEVISFRGYTATDKYHIARRHLIPKALEASGIKKDMLKLTDGALRKIIDEYTMESGVRGLKKQIDTLCRTAAVRLVKEEGTQLTVNKNNLTDYLGRKQLRHDRKLTFAPSGVATGLAWSSAGGDILFIETILTEGSGKVTVTGKLGDVMKESVKIALSLVKSLYPKESAVLDEKDLHVHVPAGAIPKDGPSAGITLTTALASLVTGRPVSTELAMTGEVSLRGAVLPIGGLPEKLMAAQRAGITKVLIPTDNVEDLEEVAEEVKDKLEIIPVRKVSDVLKKALL